MLTDRNGRPIEFSSTRCPGSGTHEIEWVEWIWNGDWSHPVPGRACIKCGLRDTYIEEGEL